MGGAHPHLGFRLVVAPGGPGRRAEPGHDAVVARSLAPGLALEVVTLAANGRLEPVGPGRCRRWGLSPASALAQAEAATAGLATERHLWRLDGGCWLTLLRAGPFTTGLVADLARRVPDGDGHGLLAAPDPGTVAVVSAPRALDRAALERATGLLGGLVERGSGTIRSLIQFHPAGEFAIFGTGRNRPDHLLP